MHDPLRQRGEDRRFWRTFLLWGVTPWWRVSPDNRPIMWRVFWWRVVIWLLPVVALVGIGLLIAPTAAMYERIAKQIGPAAESDPGPYVLLSAMLTVLGPVVIVGSIWYGIRRYLRRRRGLDI